MVLEHFRPVFDDTNISEFTVTGMAQQANNHKEQEGILVFSYQQVKNRGVQPHRQIHYSICVQCGSENDIWNGHWIQRH
jgi:hypothetical protein